MQFDYDVVVVGAGLAGLSAARAVEDAGLDTVVLEARDRVGGKTHSHRTAYGDVVEYGGQWVGADQTRLLDLLDELDVDTRPQYGDGMLVTRLHGERFVTDTYRGAHETLPETAGADLSAAFREIERCVEEIPVEAPHAAPNAREWDATTLRQWADDQFETRAAQATFERMIPGIYTAEPSELSFLFFCYYARTAGGFDMVAGLNEAADSHAAVVVDVQSVARSLAADLETGVRYGRPVRRLAHDEQGVEAETPHETVSARTAIVALPPTLAGRIAYDPGLPPRRDELTQRMPNGAVVKCLLRYDRPFWREAGFSGFAEDDAGPADYYFDDGNREGETGRLVGFVCGDAAREWAVRSPDARRDALTTQLTELFEDERFADPTAYLDRAWNAEPFSRGAYHGYPTPGTMTRCWAAIREPVGRLHWAGAETATKWYGHMDGAIRSGERAAAEVVARLG